MSIDDERELYRRYADAVPQREREIWADRGTEVLAWARDNGPSWIWNFVNRRLEASLDGSASDALVSSSLRTVFDHVGHGLLMVSANLRILHANRAMAEMLAAQVPFLSETEQLNAGPRWARGAVDEVRDLLQDAQGGARVRHLRLEPGLDRLPGVRRFFVRVDRLETDEDRDGRRPLPIALMQVWAETGQKGPDPAALIAWFDLTQAEARLASAFASGSTLAEYSASEGVSMNTIRTQFAHLREKMEARDQADVLRILLQLSRI